MNVNINITSNNINSEMISENGNMGSDNIAKYDRANI